MPAHSELLFLDNRPLTITIDFLIANLHHTTFVKANDDDDPTYSVKTQAPGLKRQGGELKGVNVHKSAELETDRD